jgi:hypothetical protein
MSLPLNLHHASTRYQALIAYRHQLKRPTFVISLVAFKNHGISSVIHHHILSTIAAQQPLVSYPYI